MGEAKDKVQRLGNERTVHITRREAIAFINLLVQPYVGANGQPAQRGTKNKDERDRLFEALRQLGSDSDMLLEAYLVSNDGSGMDGTKAIPEVSFPTITTDTINYLRNIIFTEMTMQQALSLGRLEQRVIAAYDGKYEVPIELSDAYDASRAAQITAS